jgi:hypothetical protein
VRLQSQPFADLHALQEHERQVLESYGWVDTAAGTVHIPIQDAMRLYVARQAAAPAPTPSAEAAVPTDSAPIPAASAPTVVPAPTPLSESVGPSPSPSPTGGHP